MAFELASKLGLKNLISTDMIREVMRKIVSKELSPVIHKSSFDAYESIRIPSIRIDSVIEGFISHVEVVNVGVEAIIERSLKEGISIIIEGVHVVPGFIRKDLINKNNIIIFTLVVDDPETHKQRFFTRCRQPWAKSCNVFSRIAFQSILCKKPLGQFPTTKLSSTLISGM